MSDLNAEPSIHLYRKVRHHWLTKKPDPDAFLIAAFSVFLMTIASLFFWSDFSHASLWMTAIPQKVFTNHEYWRIFTALFAHEDIGHLLSNTLLFLPFAFALYGYFGGLVFPTATVFFGALINLLVLKTMPPTVELLGVSGAVYWMGAVWLTLYFCLESRDKLFRRILKAIGVAAVLFIPEKFQVNVSYLSHGLGFLFGVGFGLSYYFWNRKKFLDAEVYDLIEEESGHVYKPQHSSNIGIHLS